MGSVSCSISSQGERRAVWPFLGKFLRRPSPVPGCEQEAHPLPGQPRGSFPTLCVNKGRLWRTFRPCICSVLSTRLESPSAGGDLLWVPPPRAGDTEEHTVVSEQVYASCTADVGGGTRCPPARTQRKPGPARPRDPGRDGSNCLMPT